jgi:transcriptional antiterminator NusG
MSITIEKQTTMKWYIVRAQSNRERSVSERIMKEAEKGDLMNKVGQVVVPIEKSFFMKNGKKVVREKVMYPGYIFVETNAIGELKYFIRGCNGASGFLTNRAGDIQALQQTEIDRMLGVQKEAEEKEIETTFVYDEEIKIIDGPFNGFVGTIEEVKEKEQKVKVGVLVFGRKTLMELSINQIDKKPNQKLENSDLYQKILEASNIIAKSSRKPSANYMVISPSVADLIQEVYNEEKSTWRKEKIKKIFPDE